MHAEQQKVAEHAEHAEQDFSNVQNVQNSIFLGIRSP